MQSMIGHAGHGARRAAATRRAAAPRRTCRCRRRPRRAWPCRTPPAPRRRAQVAPALRRGGHRDREAHRLQRPQRLHRRPADRGASSAAASGPSAHTPIDAIPDLSDVQVIVYRELGGPQPHPGRGPGHLSDRHRAASPRPRSRWCAGSRTSTSSFVYVIFEDGTDLYWARSRVLEYLNGLQGRLPAGVTPVLGPGRHRRRLGLRVRARRQDAASTTSRSCARSTTGTCSTGCAASPASPRWRRSAAT